MFDPLKTPLDAFLPLSLTKFTQYFLVPYVAHKLIMEDLGASATVAFKEMLDSADAGDNLHPKEDDDNELDSILEMNAQAARSE